MTWMVVASKRSCAAGDMGDALRGVIDHDRQVVGRAHVAAGKDDVADPGCQISDRDGDGAGLAVAGPVPVSVKPAEAVVAARARHVEAEGHVAGGRRVGRGAVRQVPG
jgi:hypothetical protein